MEARQNWHTPRPKQPAKPQPYSLTSLSTTEKPLALTANHPIFSLPSSKHDLLKNYSYI